MSVINTIQLLFSTINPQNDHFIFIKLFYIYQRVVIFVLFSFKMKSKSTKNVNVCQLEQILK